MFHAVSLLPCCLERPPPFLTYGAFATANLDRQPLQYFLTIELLRYRASFDVVGYSDLRLAVFGGCPGCGGSNLPTLALRHERLRVRSGAV